MGDNVRLLDIRLQFSALKRNRNGFFFFGLRVNHLAFPPEPLLACTEKKGCGLAVKRGGAARRRL